MTSLATIGFKADTRDIDTANKKLNTLAKTGEGVDSTFSTLQKTIGSVAATLAIASVGRDIIQSHKDFTTAISQLSAITGAVGDDLAYYTEQAKLVGATTTLSASQAAEAFKLIASAKPDLLGSAEALTAVTKEAVTLAEAAGIELPAAATALGSALNQFQLGADSASETINLLAASSKLGTSSIALVSEALVNVGSSANALDIDLADTVAGIQALAKAGIDGSEGGTALRQVLLKLEKTASQDLMPSVVGITTAIENLSEMQLSNTELMKMFGEEAFKSATAIIAQKDTLADLSHSLRGTSVAYEQARTNNDNLEGDLKKLNSTIESLSLSIGGDLDSSLRGITQTTNSLLSDFDALVDGGKALVTVVALGLTPSMAKYAISLAATTQAQLLAGTTATRTANAFGQVTVTAASATVATNALGVATRFLLGPWGLLITALGTAAAVFATSKTNSEELATSIETQIKVVDDLERAYTSMSNKEIGSAYLSAQKNLIEIDRQRLEIQEKMVKASNQGISGASQFAALSRSLQELNESSKGSESRLEAIQNIFNDGLNSIEWIDPLVEAEKQAKETALANEILAESYAKFLEEVRNYQSPMDSLLSKLEMVNSALAKGDLQPTDGVLGYITLLAEGIANLNEVTQEDNSYQVWLDNITSSSTQSRLESLQDEITNVWLAMDAGELDSTAGLEYIEQMEDKIKSLQKTIAGEDVFATMTDGAIEALSAIQGLSAQGSSDYKKLGIAIQTVTVAQKAMALAASASMATITGGLSALLGLVGMISSLDSGFSETMAIDAQALQGLNIWGAKSESISNSIEITADATSKLVGINTGMLNALTSLQTGIANVASMAIRGNTAAASSFKIGDMGIIENVFDEMFNANSFTSAIGDILNVASLGLFGLIGGWLGGSSDTVNSGLQFGGGLTGDADIMGFQTTEYKKWKFGSTKTREDFYSLGNDINAQFNSVFMDIADSVAQGAIALGLSESKITKSINDFEIATQKISLKDLSSEEQAAEIEAVFSSIFDDVALATIPFLTQFQKTGEGLGETLARVSTQVQVAEYAAEQLGFELGDKLADPELFAQISSNLTEMVGGLESFASKTASFIDNFAPESVKFDIAADAVTKALDDVGLALPATAEEFYALMEGASVEQVAAILNAQEYAGDYYDLLEKRNEDALAGLNAFNSSLRSLSENLRGAIVGIYGTEVATSKLALDAALQAAKMGDFSKALDLNLANLNPSMDGFESLEAFSIEQAKTANKIADLADLTEGAMSNEDLMLKANEEQVTLLTSINTNTSSAYIPTQQVAQNNDTMVIELQETRKELAEMKYALNAIAKSSQSTASDLDDITRNGIDVRIEA